MTRTTELSGYQNNFDVYVHIYGILNIVSTCLQSLENGPNFIYKHIHLLQKCYSLKKIQVKSL